MIKTTFYFGMIVILLFGSCTLKAGDKANDARNDSIKKYLDLAGDNALNKKLRNKYNDRAFSFVNLSTNDSLTRFYLSVVLFNSVRTNNEFLIKRSGRLLLERSIKVKDTLNLARYYRQKGFFFKRNSIDDSAFYYYLKAEKFYKSTKDGLGLAKVYNNKRDLQYKFDDYMGAKLSAKKAYKFFLESGNLKGQYQNLVAIGNNCTYLKEYRNAVNAFEDALAILEKDHSIDKPGTCLNNLGNVYREQKRYKKAIYYLNLALDDKEMLKNDPTLLGFVLNNLSYCKLQLKDYRGLPGMLYKSIALMKDDDGIKETTISNVYLSNYFMAVRDTLKAQLHAEKALGIAKKYGAPYYYLTALTNAGSVDGNKAAKYIVEYHKLHDSLYDVENNARNQYYTIQLETDGIRQEKDKAVSQKWIITSVSGAIIVIIILLLIITRQRSKQKELHLIQEQQKANEEIYDLMLIQKSKEEQARQGEKKRIALELHDGVMNKLASTRLNLDVLNHKKDEQTIKDCLNHIAGIYSIEQEIRNIAHDLSLEVFNVNNSFVTLVNDFVIAQNTTSKTHYKIEMDESMDWKNISSGIKMNLFRIIQEASHNINKFSLAKTAIISFIVDDNNLCLSVTDDGKGFDAEIDTEGIGLKNIKQRVDSLNGKFAVQSISYISTSINIAIPLG